jgi:hypothetical protein
MRGSSSGITVTGREEKMTYKINNNFFFLQTKGAAVMQYVPYISKTVDSVPM